MRRLTASKNINFRYVFGIRAIKFMSFFLVIHPPETFFRAFIKVLCTPVHACTGDPRYVAISRLPDGNGVSPHHLYLFSLISSCHGTCCVSPINLILICLVLNRSDNKAYTSLLALLKAQKCLIQKLCILNKLV
jgi:hypothetical protein